jgi:hypothetical protein
VSRPSSISSVASRASSDRGSPPFAAAERAGIDVGAMHDAELIEQRFGARPGLVPLADLSRDLDVPSSVHGRGVECDRPGVEWIRLGVECDRTGPVTPAA